MNNSELEENVSRLLDGDLSPDELAALEEELLENGESREIYRRMARVHSILETRYRARDFLGKVAVVPIERIVSRQRRRLVKIAVGSAAAIALLWGLLLWQFQVPDSPVARFEATPGADFTLVHESPTDGETIEGPIFAVGSSLVLREGVLEGNFFSGVRIIMEAPCKFQVIGEGRVSLDRGVAWFEIPQEAVGFTVETDQLEVVDLGTSFGVYSRADDGDEVHVTSGSVSLKPRVGGAKAVTLRTNEARRVDQSGNLQKIPASSQKFMTGLPLSKGLVARWDFEKESDGVTSDATGNGHSGRMEGQAEIVSDPERGKVLSLSGLKSKADGVNIDAFRELPGLSPYQGITLSAWIKRNPDASAGGLHAYVLGLGGSGDDPVATLGVKPLSNLVTGFIEGENGNDHQVHVTGDFAVKDGVWTHLAVTYDRRKNQAVTYVNGKAQRRVTDISRVGDGRLDWRFGVIGRTPDVGLSPGLNRSDERYFGGLIDDVRIYDRALAPKEIKALVR